MTCKSYTGRANINIYNGDCMEFMRESKIKYNLAIIDPPYGLNESKADFKSRGVSSKKWKKAKPKIYDIKDWDKEPPTKEYFYNLFENSLNAIVFGANHFIENIPNANSSSWVVWDKDTSGDFADCEIAWTSFNKAIRLVKFVWSGFRKCEIVERQHPTQKPVALYKWLLTNYAKPNDRILDTHGGSMSIAIACWDLGFDLDIIELDKDYYDKAVQRFERHINQKQIF